MRFKDASDFQKTMGYEVDGGWYPRVTKILEVKAKSGLDQFFREVGHYAAVEEVKTRSAEEGTRVHEVIQGHMTGALPSIPEDMSHVVEAFDIFNQEKGIIFHPDFVECRVWSGLHRFAGTIDALASINGKFGVLDIKTSTGFYPEYNLQTAAYVLALQEPNIKKAIRLPRDIETRWILRIDQIKTCMNCGARLREKGGRMKIRPASPVRDEVCEDEVHAWGPVKGEVDMREFPYYFKDIKAFLAAKSLWEWENNYWLRTIGYL